MSDFKAKMHQIRFRLGLRPRPRWGSYCKLPQPPSWFQGGLLLREGKGRGKTGGRGGREGRKGGKGDKEKRGEGRGWRGLRIWAVTELATLLRTNNKPFSICNWNNFFFYTFVIQQILRLFSLTKIKCMVMKSLSQSINFRIFNW